MDSYKAFKKELKSFLLLIGGICLFLIYSA